MKNYFEIILIFTLLTFLACVSKPSETSTTPVDTTPSIEAAITPENNVVEMSDTGSYPDRHECTPQGNLMEDNELFIPNKQLWVCIVADDITRDADFGDSYRILDVYDTKDCKRISRKVLPVNNSPDFPWYISENSYNEKAQVVCTAGFEFTYCFDIVNRTLLPQMKPDYLLPRTAIDAQSGLPLGTNIYENYLFNYAQDYGFNAFDLSDKKAINNLLPSAEYNLKTENEFHSLFLIPNSDNQYNAIIPQLDRNTGTIILMSLFENPVQLNPVIAKNVRNNRYQIFKNEAASNDTYLAIDLKTKEKVNLPKEVSSQPVTTILEYLRKTRK